MNLLDLLANREFVATIVNGRIISLSEIKPNTGLMQAATDGAAPAPKPASIRSIPWGKAVSQDFIEGVLWIEDKIGLKPENLMPCMAFETGRTFSPSIKNPKSTATGLIQFMEFTAKRLGTTTAKLAEMSAVTQLSYVYRYFEDFAKRGYKLAEWDLADTYMAILWPAGIGKPDSHPIFADPYSTYRVNAGLDSNKDGIVTKQEASAKVRAMLVEGMNDKNRLDLAI